MRKEKSRPDDRSEPEVPPNSPPRAPTADAEGNIPPHSLHTPTPPETQPSDPRHWEKIPKLPGDP